MSRNNITTILALGAVIAGGGFALKDPALRSYRTARQNSSDSANRNGTSSLLAAINDILDETCLSDSRNVDEYSPQPIQDGQSIYQISVSILNKPDLNNTFLKKFTRISNREEVSKITTALSTRQLRFLFSDKVVVARVTEKSDTLELLDEAAITITPLTLTERLKDRESKTVQLEGPQR